MSKRKIIFRADGNSIIGLGHLYRLLSLAEMVQDTVDFQFLIQESTLQEIIPNNYNRTIIPKSVAIKNEPDWISQNFVSNDYIIIIDGYQFESSYQKGLKTKGYKLIYIDDLATEHMYADVVINHSAAFKENDYKKEIYTQFALGTDYALLRPEFLDFASKNRAIDHVDTAFVCFGGADPFHLTEMAVRALLDLHQIEKINVVLGGAYSDKEVFSLANTTTKIKIYKNISSKEIAEVMRSSNIGIVPASTILYELCCIKMPILSGYYIENQKNIYKEFVEKKIIFDGGDFRDYKSEDFKNKISAIISEKSYVSYLNNQNSVIDGKSKARLLGLINQLNMSFKKACEKDLITVFNWSNDNLVRKNSFNSNPILLEDHKEWFLKKIKDKNTLFLIVLINGESAGVVRFEIGEEKTTIGILVDKKFRGQKMASAFLINAAKLYFSNHKLPIFAYIKKDNPASIKSFERAGYKYYNEEVIDGSNSYIYRLENKNENQ
ncbi:UDP-2,4-diacetamido-2,4,6-trideoxy-beta-L-altropyranose hydrolase [Winogradskyella sp. SM1960]|uniref:UDP-2,4-diacetamido-2,4, 6-trideoxy-beta-L-altropyranose hydrolase n=1 Tax=Winogradskyella sp. SM1960 TaxID=2865955 RepID=UPI001CD65229|nr:UDP-2,4-diacetamido-2,4,6-trideoxy-beta-L-altropyranose hydrolase [Winogradskyella sp. SM1960]